MKVSGRCLWDSRFAYREVWFSPSQGQADDFVSKGFVKLPKSEDDTFGEKAQKAFLATLNIEGNHYTLSVLSTNLTKEWDINADVPDFVIPPT